MPTHVLSGQLREPNHITCWFQISIHHCPPLVRHPLSKCPVKPEIQLYIAFFFFEDESGSSRHCTFLFKSPLLVSHCWSIIDEIQTRLHDIRFLTMKGPLHSPSPAPAYYSITPNPSLCVAAFAFYGSFLGHLSHSLGDWTHNFIIFPFCGLEVQHGS